MDKITLRHIAQYLPFAMNRRFAIVKLEFVTGQPIVNVSARAQKAIAHIVRELPEGIKIAVENSEIDGCSVTINGEVFKNDYQF
tara:strand:+ start:301 stop:552 length:252 start_codon:yes stop_codon:yes gene_type:complete